MVRPSGAAADLLAPAVPFRVTARQDLRRAPHVRVVWSWLEEALRGYLGA